MASEPGDLSDADVSQDVPCFCAQRRGVMAEVEFCQWLERGVPGYEKHPARRRPPTAPIHRLDRAVQSIEILKDELHLRDRQIMRQEMVVEQRLAMCSTEANIQREKQLKKQELQKRRWKAELKELKERHAKKVSSWKQKIREAEAQEKCEELCEWDRRRKDMEETARKMRESPFKAKMEGLQAEVREHQAELDQKKRDLQETSDDKTAEIQVFEVKITKIRRKKRELEEKTKASEDELEEKLTEQRRLAFENKKQLEELEATRQRMEKEQEMETEMEQIQLQIEKHFKEKVGGCARKTSVDKLPKLFEEVGHRFRDNPPSLTYSKVASWIIEELEKVVDKMKRAENVLSEEAKELVDRLPTLMDLWLKLFKRIGVDFPKEIATRFIIYKSEAEDPDPTCAKMAGVMVRAGCGGEIQLLLDQSGSVTAKVWADRLVPAVRSFIDAFGSTDDLKLKWGAVAYGRVENIGDSDRMTGTEMKRVVQDHEYKGNSTPTAQALELAVGKFEPNDLRMIVNFTDGEPDDIDEAKRQFDEAQQQEIIVVGVGIGSGVNEEYLKQMSSPGFVIKVDSFDGLAESLRKAGAKIEGAKHQAATCTFDEIKDVVTQSMEAWKQRVTRP